MSMAVFVIIATCVVIVGYLVFFWRPTNAPWTGVWKQVAEELEADFDPGPGGPLPTPPMVIDAVVDDIEVHTDVEPRQVERFVRHYTRVRATAMAPSEAQIKIYRKHLFSGVARAVGFQDVKTGDEKFDEDFIVKANDEQFARNWLNATVRKRIRLAGDYEFRLRRGRVIADKNMIDSDPKRLRNAIRAVAAFADGKHHVVRSFKKLAKKLGGKARKEPDRWASLTADVQGIPVTVDTVTHGTTHYNVASARVVGEKLTPIVITNDPHEFSPALPAAEMNGLPDGYSAWTAQPDRAKNHLTSEIRGQIDKLQPIKVRVDEERVRVFSVGICPSVADMQRATRLAAAIAASAGDAPYR